MSWNADDFDRWYAEMGCSTSRDQIVRRALGLPSGMDASGLLPWAGVTEVVAALNLAPGQLLVDLGCGRGGYSLEIARQTGARLLGLDFSPVAVATARGRAASVHIARSAAFCVGNMTAAGVGTGAADAVVCIETIMFVGAHLDALRERRRILAGGGRLTLTCWEATNLADERHPQWARRINLMRDLTEVGFEQADVADKPAWRDAERDLWESAIHADAAGDPATRRSSPCRKRPAGASTRSTSRAGFARRPLRRADMWRYRPVLMSGLRAIGAGGAVAAMIAGCGGGSSPNTLPPAKVRMASFSKGSLSFRYPAAWTAKQWPLFVLSDVATITYLTPARLHNPCKRSKNANGGVGITCRGGVLDALPAGNVFITWSVFGDDPEPQAGERQVIDGHRAIVSYHDTDICDLRGVQASIAAAIAVQGNWYEMEACLRGPGLRQAEAEVRAMLRSVRLHQTG